MNYELFLMRQSYGVKQSASMRNFTQFYLSNFTQLN